MIPDSYLYAIHKMVVGEVELGWLAGDSTGFSSRIFDRWFSVKHGKDMMRRGWVKLHSITDISTRVILDYTVTCMHVGDITGMKTMVNKLNAIVNGGFFCLDAAYPSKDLCDAITDKGMTPRIKNKSNTVCNRDGDSAWDDMVRAYRDHPEQYMDEYHQRSIIEAVFGAIKKMYGNSLQSVKRDRQNKDVAIRTICYNIEAVARLQVKSGKLTEETLAVM